MTNIIGSYTTEEISDPEFSFKFMEQYREPKGFIVVELSDGPFKMPVRQGMINIILWQSYFQMGKVPSSKNFYPLSHINGRTYSKIHTTIFKEYISFLKQETQNMSEAQKVKYEQKKIKEIVHTFWVSLNELNRFTHRWCGSYVQSMSILSLSKLYLHPQVQEIKNRVIDSKYSMDIREAQLNQMTDDLLKLLNAPGVLEYNPLKEYMETSSLKDNQIPQVLLAYGPRSDIDDTMCDYVIPSSTIEGLQNIQDYLIESLGAKKSGYFNKVVIKDSQYFYRKLRLVCSSQSTLYPGDCGSTETITINIRNKHKKNWIDKTVIDGNDIVTLTMKNIDNYVEKDLKMRSPLCCRHRDGCCVACSGRGNMDTGYFTNPNFHIGIHAASRVGGSTSQLVLSSKHLIKTNTKIYTLLDKARHYFSIKKNKLYWINNVWKNVENLRMRLPIGALGPLEDLDRDESVPSEETFSTIETFELIDSDDNVVETVVLTDGVFIPFLTTQALRHVISNINDLEQSDTTVSIPLNGYDIRRPFFKYIVVNDDMVAFTDSVDRFFKTKIGSYRSLSYILRDFTDLLYNKTNINVYFIELVLKAFMITCKGNYRMPSGVKENEATFCNMSELLTGRDIATKLGFEDLRKYFNTVTTYTRGKCVSLFDIFFGLV